MTDLTGFSRRTLSRPSRDGRTVGTAPDAGPIHRHAAHTCRQHGRAVDGGAIASRAAIAGIQDTRKRADLQDISFPSSHSRSKRGVRPQYEPESDRLPPAGGKAIA